MTSGISPHNDASVVVKKGDWKWIERGRCDRSVLLKDQPYVRSHMKKMIIRIIRAKKTPGEELKGGGWGRGGGLRKRRSMIQIAVIASKKRKKIFLKVSP